MRSRTKMALGEQEVLTVQEVSEKTPSDPRTVQNMALSGALPAFRVGRLWRFNAEAIKHLMDRQHL
jgi:excisionase family DNA binding protein